MYTLQEFIRYTKGWEYVIAIAVIFIFIGFWKLLAGSEPKDKQEERP